MCVVLDDTIKAYAAFLNRCRSLSNDGYSLMFSHQGETLWMNKYRHTNGKIVEVKLYPKELRIVQLTNGREVHSSSLHQS